MGAAEKLPKMQYRFLGRSGLQVSVISLGGWVTYGGHVGDQIAFDCMKAAYDAGINFFDCAEAYAGGKSEIVMGQAIKKFGWKRNDLVISTKINWWASKIAIRSRQLLMGIQGRRFRGQPSQQWWPKPEASH